MKLKLRALFLGVLFAFTVATPVMSITAPAPIASAACDDRFLGIPPWYRGLTNDDCGIKSPNDMGAGENNLRTFILTIALNLIEMAMVIVGYVAIFFILFGGFTFITSGSSPAGAEKARKMILNAVIGLTISLGAVAILNLIYRVVLA